LGCEERFGPDFKRSGFSPDQKFWGAVASLASPPPTPVCHRLKVCESELTMLFFFLGQEHSWTEA